MNLDDTMFDVSELAKKIEERLGQLNDKGKKTPTKEEVNDTVSDFGDLLDQIEAKIKSICEEDFVRVIDIDEVTDKINQKLSAMTPMEDELDKTLYDLSEISKMINKTVSNLEKEKAKREKKAKYCELARKKQKQGKKSNKKTNTVKKKVNKK